VSFTLILECVSFSHTSLAISLLVNSWIRSLSSFIRNPVRTLVLCSTVISTRNANINITLPVSYIYSHFSTLVPSHYSSLVLLAFLCYKVACGHFLCGYELQCPRKHVWILLSHGYKGETKVDECHVHYGISNFANDCWCLCHGLCVLLQFFERLLDQTGKQHGGVGYVCVQVKKTNMELLPLFLTFLTLTLQLLLSLLNSQSCTAVISFSFYNSLSNVTLESLPSKRPRKRWPRNTVGELCSVFLESTTRL
jgi:hypothetical protein